ncbi:hypothetical protein AGMMS4952_19710 [Spirochaetia bacterium]|nr:hypothetical protein AGMMS4952_19710 [Spirochaetia bacterium]
MAVKKNPSIYDDRSTIESSDELDEYGIWVKVAPQDLIDDQNLNMESLSGVEDFSAGFDPGITPEEPVTGDLSIEDLSLEELSHEEISGSIEDEDVDDLESLPDNIQTPAEDTAALLSELPDTLPEAIPHQPPPIEEVPLGGDMSGNPDLSTQLLMKIADELASIKDELSSLKDELSVIRNEKPAGSAGEDGGEFFDGEDDDKIALTGDELNNILHTADFTEEMGADAGESLGDDFVSPETAGDEPTDISSEAIATLETRDTDELKFLRETGVEPMTVPPEDTSYLEEAAEIDPEEPSPELASAPPPSLIDLETMDAVSPETEKTEDTPTAEENPLEEVSEETLFEEISFDELADNSESIDLPTIEDAVTESAASEDEPEAAGFTDMSFDDPASDAAPDAEDLSFELFNEDEENLEFPPMDLPAEELNIELAPLPDIALADDLSVEIPVEPATAPEQDIEIPGELKSELKNVLEYMDKLLEFLPEEKIEEFAQSEHYITYKKLFDELGIK